MSAISKKEQEEIDKKIIIAQAMGYRFVKQDGDCYTDALTGPHQCLMPVREILKSNRKSYLEPIKGMKIEFCHTPSFFHSEWAKADIIKWVAKKNPKFQATFLAHLRDVTGIANGEIRKPPKEIKDAITMRYIRSNPEEIAEAIYRSIANLARMPKQIGGATDGKSP